MVYSAENSLKVLANSLGILRYKVLLRFKRMYKILMYLGNEIFSETNDELKIREVMV